MDIRRRRTLEIHVSPRIVDRRFGEISPIKNNYSENVELSSGLGSKSQSHKVLPKGNVNSKGTKASVLDHNIGKLNDMLEHLNSQM